METCRVEIKEDSDKSYGITIGSAIIEYFAKKLKEKNISNSYVIVADSKIEKLYGAMLLKSLKENKLNAHIISFPFGEKNKSRKTKEVIEDKMLGLNLKRDSCILALGGGVVGDVAGFVASTYMRGIPHIQIPTTLLSMADSSIGGKTAVNTPQAKNAIGSFHQPKEVIIDIDFLKSLPKEELKNGIAEIIKHALIMDANFFYFLEKNMEKIFALDAKILQDTIKKSCEIKASVVMQDEKEKGVRKFLNYGHTIGHAIESASNYEISHGNAISIGMACAAKISVSKGFLKEGDAIRQNNLLEHAELLHRISHHNLKPGKILEHLVYDKKIKDGRLNFVLLKCIGDAFVSDSISTEDIKKVLQ